MTPDTRPATADILPTTAGTLPTASDTLQTGGIHTAGRKDSQCTEGRILGAGLQTQAVSGRGLRQLSQKHGPFL